MSKFLGDLGDLGDLGESWRLGGYCNLEISSIEIADCQLARSERSQSEIRNRQSVMSRPTRYRVEVLTSANRQPAIGNQQSRPPSLPAIWLSNFTSKPRH